MSWLDRLETVPVSAASDPSVPFWRTTVPSVANTSPFTLPVSNPEKPPLPVTVPVKVEGGVTANKPVLVALLKDTLPATVKSLSKVAASVTSRVPWKSALASRNTTASVVPDLIVILPDASFKLPKSEPASFRRMLPPATSNVISPATSTRRLPDETSNSLSVRVI